MANRRFYFLLVFFSTYSTAFGSLVNDTINKASSMYLLGDEQAFWKEFDELLEYSERAYWSKIEGVVIVTFQLSKQGKPFDFRFETRVHLDCERAALDAIYKIKWKPDSLYRRWELPCFFKRYSNFNDEVKKSRKKASKHFLNRDYRKALDELNRAINFNPYDIESRKMRAVVHHKMKNPKLACIDNNRLILQTGQGIGGIVCNK